jgi:hypothetical protein
VRDQNCRPDFVEQRDERPRNDFGVVGHGRDKVLHELVETLHRELLHGKDFRIFWTQPPARPGILNAGPIGFVRHYGAV